MSLSGDSTTVVNVENRIEELAERTDLSVDELTEKVDAKHESMMEHKSAEITSEELRVHALKSVYNEHENLQGSNRSSGEVEELPILTLGYQYKDAEKFYTDEDALSVLALVNPPEDPAGLMTMLLEQEDGLDLSYLKEVFQPLNTVRGYATRRPVGSYDSEPKVTKGGNAVYTGRSTSESKFEVVDPDEMDDSDPLSGLPADQEAKRELLHDNFLTDEDRVTVADYAEHQSVLDERGYAVALGADIKRFRGEVVDTFHHEESGFTTMTMTDDTVFTAEDIPEELVSDKMRTPGLQVQIEPEMLTAGEGSVLDVYGFIDQYEGHYSMNAFGFVPIVEYPRDESTSGSDSTNKPDDGGTI